MFYESIFETASRIIASIDPLNFGSIAVHEFPGYVYMNAFLLPRGKTVIVPFYDAQQPFFCFTNFTRTPITVDGLVYPTPEHYFQAQKFLNPTDQRAAFLIAVKSAGDSPMDALTIARAWTRNWTSKEIVAWDAKRENVMEVALRAKIQQYPHIVKELLSTENYCLVEDTGSRNEKNWGWGADGRGANRLGILWMKLRNELWVKQNKKHLVVSPEQLYKQAQAERMPLGVRNTIMQQWSDVIRYVAPGVNLPSVMTTADVANIFALAKLCLQKMKRGEHAQAKSRKGEIIVYGISQQFGSFYMRGTDRHKRPIDVYIKNNQIFENNKAVKQSTWADWAFAIVKQHLSVQMQLKPQMQSGSKPQSLVVAQQSSRAHERAMSLFCGVFVMALLWLTVPTIGFPALLLAGVLTTAMVNMRQVWRCSNVTTTLVETLAPTIAVTKQFDADVVMPNKAVLNAFKQFSSREDIAQAQIEPAIHRNSTRFKS
ncbi:NADAR family protein [Candidatus Berkiella cookevillensis]|uniref:NADAR family protein n=1 Tax=Candidatus Berkiella cookevillensis TaxID=437022 RepID=A0A0Q9YLB5_9GAMM|nr:NADAR family protein [Candidatus Berkiella cookevillensis]MCS5708101.1 NADAR family protein [Candidatus Berkiella cookevillensis]